MGWLTLIFLRTSKFHKVVMAQKKFITKTVLFKALIFAGALIPLVGSSQLDFCHWHNPTLYFFAREVVIIK